MLKNILRAIFLPVIMSFCTASLADDLDIFSGTTISSSAPAELVFAIDTSSSMSCAIDQDMSTNPEKCFVNLHPDLLADQSIVNDVGLQGYELPHTVKLHLIRNAMNNLLGNEQVMPDHLRVGLAFYNEPGGSIVQPLEYLGRDTGDSDYPTHRQRLLGEINHVLPQGETPLLGTLLEIGQYLTSGQVVSGKRRMPRSHLVSKENRHGLLMNHYASEVWGGYSESYGETSRTSHINTVQQQTLNYSASPHDVMRAASCVAAVQADPVRGKSDPACMFEQLGDISDDVFYNEDVNTVSVCSNHPERASSVSATQVVVLSDGLSNGEDMSFELDGVPMATWVKRFVLGDPEATGVLHPGAIDQSLDEFPIEARFRRDLGCLATAHSNASDADAAKRRAEFDSCLYHIANRFRELGVKLHVIGFDIDDRDYQPNNNDLMKIAQIAGGRFISTRDAKDVESLITQLIDHAGESLKLSVPLSPATAVNPGAILSDSGDVFVPGFEASNTRLFYGNLKKYQLTVVEDPDNGQEKTVLSGVNGVATKECDIAGSKETYTCFHPSIRDLWTGRVMPNSEQTLDFSKVTVGGAAAIQRAYGAMPDGGRKVFVQNGRRTQDLSKLNLIALDNRNPNYGSPDENAVDIADANSATQNYYARLVNNPLEEGAVFRGFTELQGAYAQGESSVMADAAAYDYVRWLNGFDQTRFSTDGAFNPSGRLNERALLDGKLLPTADTDKLKSRLYYGAIVHSTPVVVNYGFTRNPDGRYSYDNIVFFSGNDGFLRALDAETGSEAFAFFPEVLIKNIPAWYQNKRGNIQYGLDASWTPWRQDLPDTEGNMDGKISDGNGFVRLYGGMRRGGSSYFFLDVTHLNQPRLLREISPEDEGFSDMGQTWSQPVLARIKKPGESLPSVVAVFGGGYDPDYDPDVRSDTVPHCLDAAEKQTVCGNQIYMVDAGGYSGQASDETGIGDIVWRASSSGTVVDYSPGASMRAVVSTMNHSIVSRVRTLDIDDDGLTDRIYVGDLGGQVFRIRINNKITDKNDPRNEFIEIDTLAQVGLEGFPGLTVSDNRMFYEAPAVAMMKNGNQVYIGVAIASGWRAHPSDKQVNNELYFFRDTLQGNTSVIRRPVGGSTNDFIVDVANFDGTFSELDAARAISATLHSEVYDGGEKAFGSPVILFGNVFVPVYVPPTTAENERALTHCEPPPHRSTVLGFMVQSDTDITFTSRAGLITPTSVQEGVIAVFRGNESRSIPFNGLGIHRGDEAVSILAGTEAITVPLPEDVVKKTRWQQLATGKSARPQGAFGTGSE